MADEALLRVELGPADGDRVVVQVYGEFDLAGVERFAEVVDEAVATGAPSVELDLEGVSFIDSSGVGALVVGARTAADRGAQLRIGARSPMVSRVLQVSGIEAALAGGAE